MLHEPEASNIQSTTTPKKGGMILALKGPGKSHRPLRGEKKDLHLTGSAHADEFYISTPTYPHSKAWTLQLS